MRLLATIGLAAAANHYCEFNVPAGEKVVRIEGKMNVPVKPAVEPGKVLFLWPGLNLHGGQGGMMQPVLTYGADYGQGARKWGMANWFTNCGFGSGYCHGPYQPVAEGETLSWSMQYVGMETNGSQRWDMHWSAYNSGQASTFPVYREEHDPQAFWGTEAEFYLDSSDPSNYDKLPQSPYYTWDMRALTESGQALPLAWTTHGDTPGDVRVNCTWTDGDGGHVGTELSMPHGGCPAGFSRAYEDGCNSYCGCTNADGTRKVSCDFCCQDTGTTCRRAKGPVGRGGSAGGGGGAGGGAGAGGDIEVEVAAKPSEAHPRSLPRAGQLAQSRLLTSLPIPYPSDESAGNASAVPSGERPSGERPSGEQPSGGQPIFPSGRVPGEHAGAVGAESWRSDFGGSFFNVTVPALYARLVPNASTVVIINPGGACEDERSNLRARLAPLLHLSERKTAFTQPGEHSASGCARARVRVPPSGARGSSDPDPDPDPNYRYKWLSWELEGESAARWLNSLNVSAYILKYRVPARPWRSFGGAPLDDLQRAMGIVRSRLPPGTKLGVLGFSAGSHLSAHLSNDFEARTYARIDAADDVSCRPDYAMILYPWCVVGSTAGLGAHCNADTNHTLSMAVTGSAPPTFLVQAEDDAVHVENSLLYYLALKAARAAASELHVYPRGGHGFGLCSSSSREVCSWTDRAQQWLQAQGVLAASNK